MGRLETPRLNDGNFWAGTTVATLPPAGAEDSRVFIAAMEYAFVACGQFGGNFGGSGWSTSQTTRGDVPETHQGSEYPPVASSLCNRLGGEPKAAADGTNIFLLQQCTVDGRTPPFDAPNYSDGVIIAKSTDRGHTFPGIACAICSIDVMNSLNQHRYCDGTGQNRKVDAPNLVFDVETNQLFAAWQGTGDGMGHFSRNKSINKGCNDWELQHATTLAGPQLTQRGLSIATSHVNNVPAGHNRLVVAFWNELGANVYIRVSYAVSTDFNAWTDLPPLETTAKTGLVANGQIKHDPRVQLIRQTRGGAENLVLAYPAYNTSTGRNEIHTKYSTDGAASWSSATLPAVSGYDRFFPALSTRADTNEVVLVFYEQLTAGGAIGLLSSAFDVVSHTWSAAILVTTGAGAPFLPCTIVAGTSLNFFGEYLGAGATFDAAPGAFHWPGWADSRNAPAATQVWWAGLAP